MVGSIAGDPGQVGQSSPAVLRRSARPVKPTGEGKEISQRESLSVADVKKLVNKRIRQALPIDSDLGPTVNVENETVGSDGEGALLLRVLEELKDLKTKSIKQQELICKLEQEVSEIKEELERVAEQLENTTRNTISPPFLGNCQASYADIIRTPPNSLPSNIRTILSHTTTPSNKSELIFFPVDSSDLTAAVLRLPGRLVFVASVYVGGVETQALTDTCRLLRRIITDTRRGVLQEVDVVISGDFNRHDQLWGGDEVRPAGHGEADEIIDLMAEFSFHSLLLRGKKTWKGSDSRGRICETTIDLVLASEDLANDLVKCGTHHTEHGSDHSTIKTIFETEVHEPKHQECLLVNNAPWTEINVRIASALERVPAEGTVWPSSRR
ncbi:reverse transcriptase [Metarhizium brunneum]